MGGQKSSAVKLADGTLQRHRDTAPECEADPGRFDRMPNPPDSLSGDGLIHWKSVGPELIESGLLRKTDLAPFLNWCICLSMIEDAVRPSDKLKAIYACNHYEKQFGCTPTSRKGLPSDKPKSKGVRVVGRE